MEHAEDQLPEGVWQALSYWGLVLEPDKALPSVASIIAGQPIAGAWWGNPAARGTYEALRALEDRPDVLRVKLISGKVTFVIDRLWPAVLAVAQGSEPWKLADLTPGGPVAARPRGVSRVRPSR